MSIHLRDGFLNQSVDHVLEDILVRFVVNVPKEDLSSLERVCFQVEEGQWFYTDFVRLLNPALPSMKMKSFAPRILSKCPLIWKWGNPSDALSQFGKYKSTIPVRGIALMNKDLSKVILVRGPESGTWSFPRGKISKDETDIECAIREVREETSFDARKYVNENDVLERTIGGKNFRIFLARNVPEDFNFEPLVRCEIADIKWFNIKNLRKSVRTNHNKYYVVNAMIEPLVGWVNKQKGLNNEDALMRDAELKLKQLMGISASQEPEANNDAGRELLNILQGSKPLDNTANANGNNNWNGPVNVPMTLPQHLQDIYAGPGHMPQFLPPFYQNGMPPAQFPVPNFNGAFGKPFQPPPPPHPMQLHPVDYPGSTMNHAQSTNSLHSSAANPTLGAPSSALGEKSSQANSKELLSILKGKPAPKILHKQPESIVNSKPIEQAPKPVEVPAKKITLLKRNKSNNESDSATLLSILGKKPPSPESPKSQATEGDIASNAPSFLSILNSGRKNSEPEKSLAQPIAHSPAFAQSSSAQLLSSLQLPGSAAPQGFGLPGPLDGAKPAQNQSELDIRVSDIQNSSSKISAPAQFLSILKKGSVSQQSAEVNSPTNQFGLPQTHTAEEQTQPPKLDLSAGNQILSMLNRNTETPKSTRYDTPPVKADFSKFENFDDFEDFEDFDDISESQKDIYNSIANNFDVATDEDDYYEDAQFELPKANPPTTAAIPFTSQDATASLPTANVASQGATNSAGAGLLLLLQGGHPSARGPFLSLQDTYGTQDQLQQQQQPVAPSFDSRRPSNGALILRLLKREKQ